MTGMSLPVHRAAMPLSQPHLTKSRDMRYRDALMQLQDALQSLDELDESMAAAHLATAIDIVADRFGQQSCARH